MGLILAAMTLVTLSGILQASGQAPEMMRPMSVTPTDEPMLAPQPLIRDTK
jgi:hypothetical protein